MRPDERRERHEAAYICCAGGGQTSGGKVLIVYFTADENREVDAVTSASLTTVDGVKKGRVRAVADMIQAETGGGRGRVAEGLGAGLKIQRNKEALL